MIVFRVDSSQTLGMGHVMRCLTLADQLMQYGKHCLFIGREMPGHGLQMVASHGHEVLTIGRSYSDVLDPMQDAQATLEALAGRRADWLIVDHYQLDVIWETQLRIHCDRILVLDDLADRTHNCDVLLDQNLRPEAESVYRRLTPAHCDLYLGVEHALLRPEFYRLSPRLRDGSLQSVLVYLGGGDLHNQTGRAIQALQHFSEMPARVILGPDHPHRLAIHRLIEGHPLIKAIDFCKNIAEEMQQADLAIGVCGFAAWERCFLGLPALVCVTADNQRQDAQGLHALGAVRLLGDAAQVAVKDWCNAIAGLMDSPTELSLMSLAARAVMAGNQRHHRSLLERLIKP